MNKAIVYVLAAAVFFAIGITSFVLAPILRGVGNVQQYAVSKVDEATRYELHKEVEDTCRAMISSYTTDKLTYEQYRDSEDKEKRGWAEQAKMRANKTASTYNEYILKNSFVWQGNVPGDIRQSMDYIE